MPIFQRRYCWPEKVVRGLYKDLSRLARSVLANGLPRDPNAGHSINRVIITKDEVDGEGEAMVVIDGQQRVTTLLIFLAAVRDVLGQCVRANGGDAGSELVKEANIVIRLLNGVLFASGDSLRKGAKVFAAEEEQRPLTKAQSRLTPTFDDRIAFYSAVLPSRGRRTEAIDAKDGECGDKRDATTVTATRRIFLRLLSAKTSGLAALASERKSVRASI